MANPKQLSETSQKANFLTGLAPTERSFNTYQGHPWTKMYDDIVPKARIEQPSLEDLDYYAKNFGLDTSVANLKNKFDKLTQQEYAQKRADYRASEDQYYKDMSQQNAQYMSAMEDATSEALAKGASRGMQFANKFAAANTLAEQNSTGALDLATQRNNLNAQEAEAYTQNDIDAEDTIRKLKTEILGQAVVDRANSVQRYAADAQLAATDATLRINNYQFNMAKEYERMFKDKEIDAQTYTTLMNVLANMYGSDIDYLGTVYNSDNNLAGTKASAARYSGGGSSYAGKYATPAGKYATPTADNATLKDVTALIDQYKSSNDPGNQADLTKLLVDYADYLQYMPGYSNLYDDKGNPSFEITPHVVYSPNLYKHLPELATGQQWDFGVKYTDKLKK